MCHMESIFVECVSILFPEGHRLHKIVNVKQMLKCEDTIELQYFASNKFCDICYWCGGGHCLCQAAEELNKVYRDVYPICSWCLNVKKKTFITK